jgi:hypothetical protein
MKNEMLFHPRFGRHIALLWGGSQQRESTIISFLRVAAMKEQKESPVELTGFRLTAPPFYKASASPIRCSWAGFWELKIYRQNDGRQLPLLSKQSSIYWEIT